MIANGFFENNEVALFYQWDQESSIRFNQRNISVICEKICNDKNCRFRQQSLRIFNHVLATIDEDGTVTINARQLSKKLGVNYDTITKCIKYLKSIGVIKLAQ